MRQPHEAISVFDMFKIGVGPSSSHTLGPWRAAQQYIARLQQAGKYDMLEEVTVLLYGSLAKTGVGHGTDLAVVMGLMGADPETVPVDEIFPAFESVKTNSLLPLKHRPALHFGYDAHIQFLMQESLPFHPNGMSFLSRFADGSTESDTYYSIGGGFVVQEGNSVRLQAHRDLPFPINTSDDILHWCRKTGLAIHEVVLENETAWRPEAATKAGILRIWETMKACMYRGCHTKGELPGGLQVQRRAQKMNERLVKQEPYTQYDGWVEALRKGGNSFTYILDAVSCFALAVNEENASFGRVVTAPTNGAAGVIPAVLQYYAVFCGGVTDEQIIRFLCTASEVGSIFKKGATISAAMGGCQAEIGVSSAMAAAALTECMGGTQRQALMASEIAMEHHLGLTCDPIGGLVQIPCIERNSMGAIKAITASQLALQSSPDFAKVSLDKVISTMWHTALDMHTKYKETSDGGLAVHVPIALSEC